MGTNETATAFPQKHAHLSRINTRLNLGHLLLLLALCVSATLVNPAPATGQGMFLHDRILPPDNTPPQRWRPQFALQAISVDANINDQIAKTQVAQTFKNTSNRTIETTFVFPLPADAAIENFTLMVNGKELTGKLMAADKAKEIYQGYVRRFEDPALLEWVGQGMFKSSVFPVPAGEERKVIFTYSQLLEKDHRLVDYQFPLSTSKYTCGPVGKLDVRAAIKSTKEIKSVYSPTFDAAVKRTDEHHAVVTFEKENITPNSNFKLYFDTVDGKIGASLLSWWPKEEDNGYFMLLASPEVKTEDVEQLEKTILFVVDHSGSMNGKKMTQAREAAKFVVNNLTDNDTFNIFRYSNAVENYKPELERFSSDTRPAAINFINDTFAGGGTNINDALKAAVGSATDPDLPTYVVFLTDGKPTVGVKDEMQIVTNFKSANTVGARIISFGVGHDVNSRLIDRLTTASNGQSVYVAPDEDIETAVSRLYSKIAAPILTNVSVDYGLTTENKDSAVNRVYPKRPVDVFAKSQVVIVGRYKASGPSKIKMDGSVNKEDKSFAFDVEFAKRGEGKEHRFVEKLWASRRIGEIIDQLDLNGQNDELVKELVDLSVKHGIMTPYTSFLADENQDKSVALSGTDNLRLTRRNTEGLAESSGQYGFQQRAAKQYFSKNLKVSDGDYDMGFGLPSSSSSGRAGGGRMGGNAGGGRFWGAPGDQQALTGGVRPAQDPSLPAPGSSVSSAQGSSSRSGIRTNKSATVFKRGNLLFASNASDVKIEEAKPTEIARFSDEYFKLVDANSDEENEALSLQQAGEDLIIRLAGKLYRIKG